MAFGKFKLLVAALACCVSTLSPAATPGLEKIRLRLDWAPWGVHAPFHLAMQKGWFTAAGLDVTIEDGNGSVTTVQIVGSGTQFDVGHAALSAMMVARDRGLPVKAIAAFMRASDAGVLVPHGSGIKGPRDLKGKKVLYTAGSMEAPFIDGFLAAGGLRRKDVQLISVDAAAKAGTYAAGRADAVFSSLPFFLPAVARTRPSDAIRFADAGLSLPGFGLFTTERALGARRDALARFASVVAASWQYIYAGHEQEAVDAIVTQRPHARLDRKILRGQIDALKGYTPSPSSPDQPIGVTVPADWTAAVATLSAAGLLRNGRNAGEFYEAGMVRPDTPVKASGR